MYNNAPRLARAAIVAARKPCAAALTGKQRLHNDLMAIKSVLSSRAEKAAKLDILERRESWTLLCVQLLAGHTELRLVTAKPSPAVLGLLPY